MDSLPDAEVGKDVTEDVVCVHGTSDFSQVVQCLACVHGYQVAWNAFVQAVTDGLECGFCGTERFEVSQVGDHELVTLIV